MSKLSTGATFVVAQVLAVTLGVAGTTYVHAHEDDARKKKSLAKQIQAQVRAMAPTLTVGAATNATNATNAAHAANADRVGGSVVQRISLRVENSNTFPKVVSLDGLSVTVGCQGGKARMDANGTSSAGQSYSIVVTKLEASNQNSNPQIASNGSGGGVGLIAQDTSGTFAGSGRRSDGSSVWVSLSYASTSTYCDFNGVLVQS